MLPGRRGMCRGFTLRPITAATAGRHTLARVHASMNLWEEAAGAAVSVNKLPQQPPGAFATLEECFTAVRGCLGRVVEHLCAVVAVYHRLNDTAQQKKLTALAMAWGPTALAGPLQNTFRLTMRRSCA